MVMEIFEFVIGLLSVTTNGIDGRTTVQKLGYFASVMLRKDLGYAADFYGPFSSSVAAVLQNLVESDFVIETGRRTVHDRMMYSYSLTEDGMAFANTLKKEYPQEYTIIRNVVRKCSRIVHCNYNVLSWAAKVHFVLEQSGKRMTYEEAMNASRSFGWSLGKREIESGVRLLQALNLIEKT
jgi:uncharacterized protein YwgA